MLNIRMYIFLIKNKLKYLHENGIGIILGLIVGLIIKENNPEYYDDNLIFKSEIFFIYFLPPISFAAGYTLQKKKFFKYFYYTNLYGILGTIITFVITIAVTFAISKLGRLLNHNP